MTKKLKIARWIKWHPRLVPSFLWFWSVTILDQWHEDNGRGFSN